MSCEEFRDSYELYSLGLLEGGEKASLEAHLAEGCATCPAQIADAFAVQALMLTQVPEVVPPSRLKQRVLASVGVAGFGWAWLGAAAAAAMLVAVLWLSLAARGQQQELSAARQTLQQTAAERERLSQVIAFLRDPGTQQVGFGTPTGPEGHVYLNPAIGVLLIASNLPAPGEGQAFEMWTVPPAGPPQPAGLFSGSGENAAIHIRPGAIDLADLAAVAVTLEPAAGSAQPTTMPILTARREP